MRNITLEIKNLLNEYNIQNSEDYLNKTLEELVEIYENMKIVQEEYNLTDDDMGKILESILGKFE